MPARGVGKVVRRLGAVLLGMAAWLAAGAAQAEDVSRIKIGLSGPFTGGSAQMGESMRNGARLAVHEINHLGGVLGRPLELVERDDRAEAEAGVRVAEELLAKEKVVATVGIANTAVALDSIDLYQRAGTPLIIAVSTGPTLTRKHAAAPGGENYVFRVSPSLALEAVALCADMQRRRLKRIALLADATPYGEAAVAAMRGAAEAAKLELVAVERFKLGEQDMSEQLGRARAAQAQALVLWGIGPELAAIARGRVAMGWQVPIFGAWTITMKSFIDEAGMAGEGALMTQTFIPDEEGSQVKNGFLLAYQSMFRQAAIPSPMSAAQAYDAVYLLAAAIRQARSVEGPKVRAALENLEKKVNGVLTTYDKPFSRDNHEAVTGDMLVIGQVKSGRVVYAYPDDARRPSRRVSASSLPQPAAR